MEIRDLTDEDLFTVVGIVSRGGEQVKDELMELRAKGNVNNQQAGISVMMSLMKVLTGEQKEEIREWFADLIGVSLEEYKDKPIWTTPQVIKGLSEKDDIKKFIDIVSNMVSVKKK